ncbi:ATP-dependent helicase HRQ1-like, partial [Telopea speciosissima]|uniref:ATP-dependent helicase HRQ1-like n=1 Tax=Telopea speciosissima TaxID=54955 RepID=UPI001CC55A5A
GSASKKVLDEKNSKKFIQFLELVDCLSDPQSGSCFLKVSLADNDAIPCNEKKKSCLCPSWLKRVLKGFAFINTFYVVFQMQQERITLDHLDGALKQLRKFGFDIDIADLKHLSVLCPDVVKFGDQQTAAANVGDSIVIFDSLSELVIEADNRRTVRKKVLTSTVLNKKKKRESAFRKRLLEAVTFFMGKTMFASRVTTLLSLEDLLKSLEESGDTAKGCEAKRTRSSATSSSHSLQALCQDTNVLSPGEMVEHLRKGLGSQGQIVHVEEIGARKAVRVGIPNELSETTRFALQRIGVTRLYSHQAESIQASLSGKDVVVATMTSSGKSLCYNVPVLEALTQNLLSCALYLFPTKALAQDQLRALLVMTEGLDISKNIGVYDGDTSQKDRKWLRDSARLLISNPDMLHMSILPYHGQFQRILSNLRFVIIDEAHAYKGAFGCHTSLILRRLRRLCCHVYGSDPSFVFSTATSANPREHAMELVSLSTLELIQKDGSPCGPKHFILWNPFCSTTKQISKTLSGSDTSKYADGEIITRPSSSVLEVSRLFAEMVQHGLRCIAFCKTRKLTELVLFYTREILQGTAPDLVGSVCAYRGGYIAEVGSVIVYFVPLRLLLLARYCS